MKQSPDDVDCWLIEIDLVALNDGSIIGSNGATGTECGKWWSDRSARCDLQFTDIIKTAAMIHVGKAKSDNPTQYCMTPTVRNCLRKTICVILEKKWRLNH